MRHFELTHEDYRKAVKDWVNKQPDDREYDYDSYDRCVVGQFISENPEFDLGRMGAGPVWFATHQDEGSYGCAGYFRANSALHHTGALGTFGEVKRKMNAHPMWAWL